MMLAESSDFVTRPAPLPIRCPAAVCVDEDGRANLYINPNAPNPVSLAEHELDHIMRGDFQMSDIDVIESGRRMAKLCQNDYGDFYAIEVDSDGTKSASGEHGDGADRDGTYKRVPLFVL